MGPLFLCNKRRDKVTDLRLANRNSSSLSSAMRLFALTTLVMIAFAANSVLNRLALTEAETGPAAFAAVRLASGAVFLWALVKLRSGDVPWTAPGRIWGTLALATYVLGFSFAYVTLDAGVGALILFGGVQITMFAGAVLARESIPVLRWIGAGVAFLGLVVLMAPTNSNAPGWSGIILMSAAALGWGVYSLLGRGSQDPLGSTTANFVLALPIGMLCFAVLPQGISAGGLLLAIVSGAVTSGAGYALWYAILPRLEASVAAVAQLSVPIIAAAGGVFLLQEPVSIRFVVSAALVLGGILVSMRR